MNAPTAEHLALCVSATLDLPISRACGLRLVEQAPGHARCRLDVTEAVSLGSGQLNGGELYGLIDYAAYLALTTLLPDAEAAVTADAHFSILAPAPRGSQVELDAHVERRGRSLAFSRVEVRLLGEGEPKTVALGTVTKSILSMERRLRYKDR